jgi:hypothetical protein
VWEAPYDGTVAVTGGVKLLKDNSQERLDYGNKADGVTVVIEAPGVVWKQRIEGNDTENDKFPENVSAVTIKKGERIYFRVQSFFDGAYDRVNWTPQVKYIGNSDLLDANGKQVLSFKSDSDFLLAAHPGQTVTAPVPGSIKIEGTFIKPVTSDDVSVKIYQNTTAIWEQNIAATDTATIPFSLTRDVNANDNLRFVVTSDSNVDWSAISWKSQII